MQKISILKRTNKNKLNKSKFSVLNIQDLNLFFVAFGTVWVKKAVGMKRLFINMVLKSS